jgi:hypothetical protein
METRRWLLMSYRLPREPSTPRITIWRKLRHLGTVQLLDGLVALPLDSRNREQLGWLADEILEAGGEASLWAADSTTAAQDRELMSRFVDSVAAEYEQVIDDARAISAKGKHVHRGTLARLRSELRRIGERDYFASPHAVIARRAVEALSPLREVPE